MDFRKQAAINSVGSVVLMFGQWLISVLLVRMSGYEDAGVFSLAMTVSNMFTFFANYGLRNYQVADVKGTYTQIQYLLARFCTSAAALAACTVYLMLVTNYTTAERWAVLCYLLYSLCNIISDILFGALQLQGRLEINGYSNVIRGALCFVAFIASYAVCHQMVLSLLVMVVVDVVWSGVYDWRHFLQTEKLKRPGSRDLLQCGHLLRACFTLMISSLLPVITTALPRLSIKCLAGTEQLGYFSTIFTPTVLMTTLVPSIIIVMVPKMAKSWNEGRRGDYLKFAGQNYLISVAFVALAEIAALLVGRPVMRLVFGAEILEHYSLLYWAILATGLNLMVSCGNSALISIHSNTEVAIAAALALGFTAGFSGPLVRAFGITGAAYVLAAAYFLQALFQTAVILYKVWYKEAPRRQPGN